MPTTGGKRRCCVRGLGRRRVGLALALALGTLAATGGLAPSLGHAASGTRERVGEEAAPPAAARRVDRDAPPERIISLNPSLTAIVLRLGAGSHLVGVDDYSARLYAEVADRARVGGLFDPSLESVVELQPDRVLLVAGVDQQRHGERLERLGLDVEVFENERFDQVLANIERLGAMLGRESRAGARIAEILAMRAAVAEATADRGRPRAVAVLDRTPLFVVGARTFLDEMLETVGARNLGRALGAGYPRASTEWLIGARPELLLDLTPSVAEGGDVEAFWSRWPSLPAVAAGRVLRVDASRVSLPGPALDRGLRRLAVLVHGAGIGRAIDAALADRRAGPGDDPAEDDGDAETRAGEAEGDGDAETRAGEDAREGATAP